MPEDRNMLRQVLSIPLLMVCVLVLVVLSTWGVQLGSAALGGSSHRPAVIYGFATVCTFLSLWVILSAVFTYINVGQKKKIEVITGFYTPDTIADYFDQFWAGRDGFRTLVANYRGAQGAAKAASAEQLEAAFKTLFATDFGLRVFVVPQIILVASGAIVLFLGYTGGIGLAVALASNAPSPVQPFGISLDLVSLAAIFGAYTWVASDVIVRNHQWTLHPSDLSWYALRLIVAIPLGQALALTVGGSNVAAGVTLPTGVGAFAAFVGSMFSLDAITKAVGTAATRFGLQMTPSTEERDDLIVKLAGVDESKAQALATEGVSTIGQLVTVDPIRTSISTGLAFEYILNLIDAALLWVFVGSTLKQLGPLGLRGSSDVLSLVDAWVATDAASVALETLRQSETALQQARQAEVAARAALDADPGPPDAPLVSPQQRAVAEARAATGVAELARNNALADYLVIEAAQPAMAPARAAMVAALTAGSAAGGPGLTEIGFVTIGARLEQDSYALFIRRLLAQ